MTEPLQPGTHDISIAVVTTKNTKEAAMLLTLGIPWADPFNKDLVRNVYSENKPYKPGMPGEVTYLLGVVNEEGVTSGDLRKAFAEGRADLMLDKLVDEIEATNPALGNRLRKLLPVALACYARGFYENRERLLDLWKHSRPMVMVRKSAKSWTLIPRDASAETRRHFGV